VVAIEKFAASSNHIVDRTAFHGLHGPEPNGACSSQLACESGVHFLFFDFLLLEELEFPACRNGHDTGKEAEDNASCSESQG
jgi:hypothetical protein